MKINCIDKDIKTILESGFHKIPRFQRPYSWDRENVEEFWNDTIVEAEPDYFIGSVVVFEEKGLEGLYGIVDGQQRLSTITMILCALRNAFRDEKFEDLAHGAHRLIERPDIDNKLNFVVQTETSYPYFQEYIQKFAGPDVEPKVGAEEQFLKAAFDFIRQQVSAAVQSIKDNTTLSAEAKPIKVKQKLLEIRDRVLRLKLIFTSSR